HPLDDPRARRTIVGPPATDPQLALAQRHARALVGAQLDDLAAAPHRHLGEAERHAGVLDALVHEIDLVVTERDLDLLGDARRAALVASDDRVATDLEIADADHDREIVGRDHVADDLGRELHAVHRAGLGV